MRSNDSRRTALALIGTGVFILLIALFQIFYSPSVTSVQHYDPAGHIILSAPPPPLSIPTPPSPPPTAAVSNPADFPPLLVEKVSKDIMPPVTFQQQENSLPGVVAGNNFEEGPVAPPEEIKGSGVVFQPGEKSMHKDSTFLKVEIEAKFPGGEKEWYKYVSRALLKKIDAFTAEDFGSCTVRFIVDTEGKVSNVEVISPKNTLLEKVAKEAIERGPNWVPAVQNGRYVKAYRLQPISFQNVNE